MQPGRGERFHLTQARFEKRKGKQKTRKQNSGVLEGSLVEGRPGVGLRRCPRDGTSKMGEGWNRRNDEELRRAT